MEEKTCCLAKFLKNVCFKARESRYPLVLDFLRFGMILDKGCRFFHSGEYEEARKQLDRALAISPLDFVANFFLVRTAIMLQDYPAAERGLAICKEHKRYKLYADLVTPWENYLNEKKHGNPCDDPCLLRELNQVTDERFVSLTQNREYDFLDVLAVLGAYFISFIPGELLVRFFTGTRDPVLISFISTLLATLFIVRYYHYNPKLHVNIWFTFQKFLSDTKQLVKSNAFRSRVGGMLFIITYSFFVAKTRTTPLYVQTFLQYPFAETVSLLLLAPVYEELAFREILYRFFSRYNKVIAVILVSLLFVWYHRAFWGFSRFIFSLFAIYVYEKDGTVAAPILVHSIYNFAIIGSALLFMK